MQNQKQKEIFKFLKNCCAVAAILFCFGRLNVAAAESPAQSPLFLRNLTIGSSGNDVLELQQYLNSHGVTVATSGPGSPGNETTLFGQMTQQALIKFQNQYATQILIPQ